LLGSNSKAEVGANHTNPHLWWTEKQPSK